MRASRLLSMLILLQTRGRMTAQALAEEFEVSIRTVYRDVDQLSAAGVPVYAERGRAGGFALLDGYRTRLTGLTRAEAETLFLAGLPGPAAELGLRDLMAAAQLKLLAALPLDWQAAADRIRARFHLDPVGWFTAGEQVGFLPAIADAVWNERRLRIRYRSWKDIVDRDLEPLGLVLKAGIWYLVAQVGGQARTYRVSSILDLSVSSGGFSRPANFELTQYWATSSRDFETGIYRETAVLRLSSRGMELLSGFAVAAVRAALETADPADAHGWRRVELPIESVEHAAGEFLKLGVEGEILEPPELRQRMAQTAERLVDLYGPKGRKRSRARRQRQPTGPA